MSRRRSVDFVGWNLYKRAWLLPAVALAVLVVTSFRPETPIASTLPPTLANEQAADLLARVNDFNTRFPDRRPGTPGSIDSAQWMRDQLSALKLKARTVPATTTSPITGKSVGLVNVEAVLGGRTRELVVIHAHRDTADGAGRGGDATGQLALLALAKELKATRDLRRSYLFVSTDGATLNGGGARALAHRLDKRGGVVAVIELDRIGAGGALRVDAAPSGEYAPPLGLVRAARDAVASESGRAADGASAGAQLVQLAAPITLREHGQLVSEGLPALTLTAGDDQLREAGDPKRADPVAVGKGLRSVQRLVGTLDQLDQIQSAGKTWIASDRRVYRGWALKILIASLLVPAWIAAVDLLVRHRRGWNLLAALGTCARAMLAGMFSVVSLWAIGAVGLLPRTGDRPPNPGALDDVHWIGLGLWLTATCVAWLLARGPDWRRHRRQVVPAGGADTPELVLVLVSLIVLTVLALAINPYTVLFAVPALHAWLWLASRRVFGRLAVWSVWGVGLTAPLFAVLAIGARGDAGMGSAWFALQLVQTRTIPPLLALLIGAAGGLGTLLIIAALGRVGEPALPRARAAAGALVRPTGHPHPIDDLARVVAALRRQAGRLRVPSSANDVPGRARHARRSRGGLASRLSRTRTRAHIVAAPPAARRPRGFEDLAGMTDADPIEDDRVRARREREARRADRARVKSR